MLPLKTPGVLPGFKLSLGLTVVPVAACGLAVCDDGGEGGGNRLGQLWNRLPGRTRWRRCGWFADVVYAMHLMSFRHAGGVVIGAL